MRALVGHTGFVGSNILQQASFDKCYNSKNIEDISGNDFELLVCAGVSSIKWKANKEPKQDFQQIHSLISNLHKARFKRMIHISTIAVYDSPADNAYGQNRLYLETYLRNNFDNVFIIRLPSLFGNGLRKNAIFDLLNKDFQYLPHQDSQFQYYCLDDIWSDITKMSDNNIKTLNLSTEPISFCDILTLFGVDHRCADPSKIIIENMNSDHAGLWGKKGAYLYDKDEIFDKLKGFIKQHE